ncbi:DNA-3-methyladenine glycosylase family protein [Tuberibacillus sp. Marseille-P3662]|uniref:DNA-3-methyladenine glycosylase family protein n=1 Tax=Tuberibacillus sp. Marseille-P3662 TaxID=1965358 RepID=UPI000A1CE6DC|nr:DNA-3-methyladenine glycosylase [Tuberibacillus sp. Marseille-P3662]
MWTKTIKIEPPYDFDRGLRRLAFNPLNQVDIHERHISVPLWQDDEPIVVHVKATGRLQSPSFRVTSNGEEHETIQQLTRIFNWDQPLQPVIDHFQGTQLESLFTTYYGTPVIKDFSLYRSLMTSIIHQQLNLKVAHMLTERFVHTFGFQHEGVWFYPQPQTVAALDYQQLRELKFSQRKSEYLIDTSRMIAEGQLDLPSLHNESDEDVIKTLVKVRGIGPWTAQSLLLSGMGRSDLMPAKDIGLQNAIKGLLGLERKPSVSEIEVMSQEWRPYNSYAALYLWESLGNQTV